MLVDEGHVGDVPQLIGGDILELDTLKDTTQTRCNRGVLQLCRRGMPNQIDSAAAITVDPMSSKRTVSRFKAPETGRAQRKEY